MFAERVDVDEIPADVRRFNEVYASGDGCMLAAWAEDDRVVASIAYRPYDGRFPHLNLMQGKVVEVVRLYVDPAWRRQGLAARLYAELRRLALEQGVQVFYLHTHPFLAGAEAFWRMQGFELLCRDADPVWQTIHMQALIRPPAPSTKR
ncbi:GNAT family N-acetyltransferase [Diaphorobacter sp. NR2-3-3-1]|nr:GNAT family N-acetyltransferase [Diaphorobacter caeni]